MRMDYFREVRHIPEPIYAMMPGEPQLDDGVLYIVDGPAYPDNILTAAIAQRWCKYGVAYMLLKQDSLRVSGLDSQKASGASIFGGGFLLSTRAAAERAAAERAAASVWKLSETERCYVEWMDKHNAPTQDRDVCRDRF